MPLFWHSLVNDTCSNLSSINEFLSYFCCKVLDIFVDMLDICEFLVFLRFMFVCFFPQYLARVPIYFFSLSLLDTS
uniref:Uncharacterized protein n=1 Tax=Rhizophora mucronata TaxID=61149 RepID=A0A2P2NTF1_RHIMU